MFDYQEQEGIMKAFIEISGALLEVVDEMIEEGYFNDRTEAVNQAVEEMLHRYKIGKLHMKEIEAEMGGDN
jgi:metal-responsive CopG/Arc/MetJ family transcriptional regulator